MSKLLPAVLAVAVLGVTGTAAARSADVPADTVVPARTMTIVETARAAGNFTTLLAAVEAAGLTGTLSGPGPFTVFAPTDEAFAALPEGTIPALLNDLPQLRGILTYHVVGGFVPASEVTGMTSVRTLNGRELSITVRNGEVRLNGVRVIQTDIRTSNGVIHVIEGVLLPNQ